MGADSQDGMLSGGRLEMLCLDLDPLGRPDGPLIRPELLARLGGRPDLIFLQGARGFDADGDALLYSVGRRLGNLGRCTYRCFLTTVPGSPRQQVVYVNDERVEPTRHWHRFGRHEVADLRGFLEVVVDHDEHRPLLLASVDLGGDHGRAAVRRIQVAVGVDRRAVLAGCFRRGVLDALFAGGWQDQRAGHGAPVPLSRDVAVLSRCVTAPGWALVARLDEVDLVDITGTRCRALSGVLSFLDDTDSTVHTGWQP